IYFGTEGATFFCIDWKQLKQIWHWTDKVRSASIRSSAALTSEIVVFGGQDKMVHAFRPESGDALWHFQTKGGVDDARVIVGRRVYFGSADGRVYGLDLKSGAKVWEYEAGGHFLAGVAVASGKMLIASDDGFVYCFGEKQAH